MDTRGVLTADAVISLFLIILLTSLIMSTAAERLDGVYRSRSNLESRLLMDRTAHQINLAAAGGPGHQVLIELPGRLNHTCDYSLDVNSTGVYGWFDGRRGFSPIHPVIILDGYGNPGRVRLQPGKRYLLRNTPRNGRTAVMIMELKGV
ncbi:hypothetical protein U2150_03595 [Methanothermobacter wolfeii]|uniref:Uncharacterized protein n=1 Tax=Methanothermobacter wolfeii TaxID=145261 RepID=A0ABU8TV45_METWO